MEDTNREEDIFGQPLVNQPGEKWEYGVSMDWIGRLVERVSGLSLGDYMEQNIFKPLKMTQTSFCPTPEMKANLAYMHQRDADGSIRLRDNGHLLQRPLRGESSSIIHSGGAGLFSTPSDYGGMSVQRQMCWLQTHGLTLKISEIIATILNHGTHAKTGHQLLKPKTVDGEQAALRCQLILLTFVFVKEMLRNQIPQLPEFGRNLAPACKPAFVSASSEIYPQPHHQPQGWGLSFFKLLSPGPAGRPAGSIWWTGLANLFWWADVEQGIGGMLASQILPFGGTFHLI
jgi:CubicO group peptidase (beta-lactamase class C family)